MMNPEEIKLFLERIIKCDKPVKLEISYSGNGGDFKVALSHKPITDPDDEIITL